MSLLEIKDLKITFGGLDALSGLNFDIDEGEIVSVIGPNGAGKTTTMECIEGLRRPDRGQIEVFGLDPLRDAVALQHRIGVQFQEAQLQKRIKVWEAVALWASLYETTVDADRILDQLGLSEKRNAWFMNLSGGQKQRLFIALALINDPELVFLDELTTGLDPQARRAIWELVRNIPARGKTVFLTTHLMEEAERLCDRVAIIDHGRIIDHDTPAGLIARHCPDWTVIVSTAHADAASCFSALPSVDSVTAEDDRLTLQGHGDDLVTEIIHCLSEHGMRVTEFRTEQSTLEDVFLTVTGRSIRE